MNPNPGDIFTYSEMCQFESFHLRRGMNFRLKPDYSIVLMSACADSLYTDIVQDEGKTLLYEGHDISKRKGLKDPRHYDQPMAMPNGKLTQNGLFYVIAKDVQKNKGWPEPV